MTKHSSTMRDGRGLLVAAGALALFAACGSSNNSLRKAEMSAYDADFALVFETVGKVIRTQYPNGADDAAQGVIKTSWHVVDSVREEAPPNPGYEVRQPTANDESNSVQAQMENRHKQAQRNEFARENQTGTNYFVRFDVFVEGQRPFRIRVQGFASEWEKGLSPRPLNGDERPYWVSKREDALRVAIYEELSDFAVPIQAPDAPGNTAAK